MQTSDDREAAEPQRSGAPDAGIHRSPETKLTSPETPSEGSSDRGSPHSPETEIAGLSKAAAPEISEPAVSGPPRHKRSGYRSSIVIGFLLLLVGFGGFGTWAAVAPLRSGAMAAGVVKLAGERKTIQHLEGGIIQDILVEEGDAVETGQVLIRLDGNQARASLDALTGEYYALRIREARLQSERLGLDTMRISDDLRMASYPNIGELIEGEQNLFSARRTSISDQLSIYDSWQETYRKEISGLVAQRSAAKTQLEHINEELEAVDLLFKEGLMDKPRLLELKRTAAGLAGRIGSLTSDIARTEQKIGEARLRAISLQTQHLEQVSSELQQVQSNILTLEEQLRAASDVVKRLDIIAPRSGRVVELRFHTPGGVITPSTPILDIVPADDKLIVEARVDPMDIDIVVPGVEAQIQLTAYSMRKTPPLPGKVVQVSADRIDNPTSGESYYMAQVEVDPAALQRLDGVTLYPGMPAAVQLVTGERTALDYLLSPIEAGLRRTWLED